jgi:allantoinase
LPRVWVIPNIEFFSLKDGLSGHPFEGKGPAPSVRAWSQRDYGNRVGIWRIMEVLTKHGIRASPTVNSDVCVHHPETIEECLKLGWQLVGHNKKNSERLNEVPIEAERALIRNTQEPVRCALPRGRAVRPGDGDLPASVHDRGAAPHWRT